MTKSRRTTDQTPDLFDAAASRAEPTRPRSLSPAKTSYVLPADLGAAISGLSDADLNQLATAVAAELERRRLPVATAPPPPTQDHAHMSPRSKATKAGSRIPNLGPAPMTNAKLNAIRAALAAGVKPSALARQFGVSQTAIREALAQTKRK